MWGRVLTDGHENEMNPKTPDTLWAITGDLVPPTPQLPFREEPSHHRASCFREGWFAMGVSYSSRVALKPSRATGLGKEAPGGELGASQAQVHLSGSTFINFLR